jgi:hypothetical protein
MPGALCYAELADDGFNAMTAANLLPIVSPTLVNPRALRSMEQHELRPCNANEIKPLDQKGASSLR